MGFESFNDVPTKESTQAALDQAQKQLEKYENDLQTAKNTPVSNLFTEGSKDTAVANFQQMVNNERASIEKYEKELADLN